MFAVLLALFLSFCITFLLIPVIIFLSEHLHLYDVPDERKVHARPISRLGGVGIFAGFAFPILLLVPFSETSGLQYVLAAALLLFFVGLKDDLSSVSPFKKVVAQSIAAFILVGKGGLVISSMHGFMGVYQLSYLQSFLLTYLAIIVIINSINLIDGIDGLAGSLCMTAVLVLGVYFLRAGLPSYSILAFALLGSLSAFLIFNFQPARIFMGDTGSLVTGTICAVLVIKFIELSSSNEVLPITASPAVGFSIFLIPLLDTLRVFSIRVAQRRSPFSPDRNHIHHILLNRLASHFKVTVILVCGNTVFIALAFMSREMGCTWLFFFLSGLFFFSLSAITLIKPLNGRVATDRTLTEPYRNAPLHLSENTLASSNDSVGETKVVKGGFVKEYIGEAK